MYILEASRHLPKTNGLDVSWHNKEGYIQYDQRQSHCVLSRGPYRVWLMKTLVWCHGPSFALPTNSLAVCLLLTIRAYADFRFSSSVQHSGCHTAPALSTRQFCPSSLIHTTQLRLRSPRMQPPSTWTTSAHISQSKSQPGSAPRTQLADFFHSFYYWVKLPRKSKDINKLIGGHAFSDQLNWKHKAQRDGY